MAGAATPGREVVLETDRLLLRPWRISEAAIQRELWTERDPRVPPHRRIDADGHPTVADIEDGIRAAQRSSVGLLAVERKAAGDVIGYCGLVDSGRGSEGEPELAYELLRRVWVRDTRPRPHWRYWTGRDRPGTSGCLPRVWEWNTASRRVLAKLGFAETDRKEGCDPRDQPVHHETALIRLRPLIGCPDVAKGVRRGSRDSVSPSVLT
jgi:ribosomal-protein-alanine N-acetyltransferase